MDFQEPFDMQVIPPGETEEVQCDFGAIAEGVTRDGYTVRLISFGYTLNGKQNYVSVVEIPERETQYARILESREELAQVTDETLDLLMGKK